MKAFYKKLNGKKIGILGLGYIGNNLVNYLNEHCSDSKIIKLTRNNLTDIESEEFDYFINCAGNSGDFRLEPEKTVEDNISLNLYLLKNLKVTGTFLFLSSTRVYGFKYIETKFSESSFDILNLDSSSLDFIYNGSKLLSESLLLNSSNSKISNCVVVRLSNVYGKIKDLNDATLIKKMFRLSLINKDLEVLFNAKSNKDFIFIDDALDGILLALINGKKAIYNIASGISSSTLEIAELLNIKVQDNVKNEAVFSGINIQKAIDKLKFNPEYSLKKGLEITIKELIK